MRGLFSGARSFDQDIGKWDVSRVSNMWGMLNGSGLDCSNYSATMIGWADHSGIKDGMSLGAEGLVYGSSALHARDEILIEKKGWNIRGDSHNECLSVSISNLDDDFPGIAVFPNPATDLIRLSGEWELGTTRVEIYNTTGVIMGSYTVDISPEATFDISEWSAGVYIIRIAFEDAVRSFRFLKL